MGRWTAAVALAAAMVCGGCSPLLYLVMRARSGGSQTLTVGQPVTGNTTVAGDDYAPQCMGDDARDETWSFTAPTEGLWRFVVDGQYDSVLAVSDGTGHELACNDDHGSTRRSLVDVPLHAGQRVDVVVDGYHGATGSYTLRVDDRNASPVQDTPVQAPPAQQAAPPVHDDPQMVARCMDAPALTPGVVSGTLAAAVHTAAVSCGDHGPGGDVVYRFDATTPGTLSLAESSFFDALLEIRDGCAPAVALACNDDAPDTRHAAVSVRLPHAGRYYVVVDAYAVAAEGPYSLLVTWSPELAGGDAPPLTSPAGPSPTPPIPIAVPVPTVQPVPL